MDSLLLKYREVFAFTDDILIVSKETIIEHLHKVRGLLKILDDAKLQLEAGKWKFQKRKVSGFASK